jgi:hypothetical protein
LPHTDKDLAVLKQFEPPVGPGRFSEKSEACPVGRVRTAFCHMAQVAPIRRPSAGAYAPITNWLLYGDP